MSDVIIEIKDLVKEFRSDFWKKKVRVLDGVNLQVNRGDVFGFLGPNGAGKTTTLKILMGLNFPTSGNAKIFGQDIGDIEIRRRIGFLPENPYFYEYLETEEFLGFYADLFGLRGQEKSKRIDHLLELVGMDRFRGLQLRKYSKGMLQRIGIAQALINDPELVVFDEPQSGLDPIGRRDVREIMYQLKEAGKTVFYSSHIMHDVEAVSEKIGIIINGKIQDVGRIEELIDSKIHYFEIFYRSDSEVEGEHINSSRKIGSQYVARIEEENQVPQIVRRIYDDHGVIDAILPHKGTLEDLFVKEVEKQKARYNP